MDIKPHARYLLPVHTEQTPPKSDVIDLNSMYALVLGLLLVLGLSGDTSGMCGESRQQIESHIGSSEGLSHRRETPPSAFSMNESL